MRKERALKGVCSLAPWAGIAGPSYCRGVEVIPACWRLMAGLRFSASSTRGLVLFRLIGSSPLEHSIASGSLACLLPGASYRSTPSHGTLLSASPGAPSVRLFYTDLRNLPLRIDDRHVTSSLHALHLLPCFPFSAPPLRTSISQCPLRVGAVMADLPTYPSSAFFVILGRLNSHPP